MWRRAGLVAATSAALLGACKDGEPSRPETPFATFEPLCTSKSTPVASAQRVRRLADVELDAVLTDLLGEPVAIAASLIADPRVDGYDADARGLVVSSPKLDGYATALEPIANTLADRAACDPLVEPRACADAFLRDLAPRAWGRPMTEDEASALLHVFETGETPSDGMRLVAQAILLAPSTLYREEIGTGGGDVATLDDFEIASQLSFLLTGARPDAGLRDAAMRGQLHDPAVVRAHAERLLDTPRAKAQLRRFVTGWLELGKLGGARKGPEYAPFDAKIRSAMIDELGSFVDREVFERNGSLDGLLTATNERPASLAPIEGDAPRHGLLALPAFLTGHATRDGTNPVDRGLFVRTRILCQEFGPPPLQAFAMPVDPLADKTTTTRQKFELHTTDPMCETCHDRIDPVGFGFEGFDAIGRRRAHENGLPIDDSGFLSDADVGGAFHGPEELETLLLGSDSVRTCFVAQVFRFAEGRHEGDVCELADQSAAFVTSGDRVRDLLLAYVTRPEFFVRRVVP
jgi:hypothetical protein